LFTAALAAVPHLLFIRDGAVETAQVARKEKIDLSGFAENQNRYFA
jgi:hypothetical protein